MNIIGIYPGSFQLPHRGNYAAYEFLKKVTGTNTFVTTTDVVDLPASPLNFLDKQQIWTRHGVPIDKVVKVKDPHKAVEITQKFGADRTAAVFAMPKAEAMKYLQSTSGYFLPFRGLAQTTQPLNKHAYILTIPDEILAVRGADPDTLKRAFSSKKLTDNQKKSLFKQVFGWYDISLFELISKKFAEAQTVKERVNETTVFRRFLKPFIREVLAQLSQPQGDQSTTSMDQTDPQSAAEKAKEKRDQQTQITLKAKAKDAELKTLKNQQKYFKGNVDKLTRFDIPQANKELQALKAGKNI